MVTASFRIGCLCNEFQVRLLYSEIPSFKKKNSDGNGGDGGDGVVVVIVKTLKS